MLTRVSQRDTDFLGVETMNNQKTITIGHHLFEVLYLSLLVSTSGESCYMSEELAHESQGIVISSIMDKLGLKDDGLIENPYLVDEETIALHFDYYGRIIIKRGEK
jgi:hypothetical protein